MGASFEIRTADDFLEKLREEHAAVAKSPTDSRHAINAALTAFHLSDWIWKDRLEHDPALKSLLLEEDDADWCTFREWAYQECSGLRLMRDIANGSKHFHPRGPISETREKRGDWAPGDWDRHDFAISRLIIEKNDSTEIAFDLLLDEVVEWWECVFARIDSEAIQ
jgi:hypothetical protein